MLNEKPSLTSVVAVLSALDRKQHDYFLTVSFGDGVELGGARRQTDHYSLQVGDGD